MAAYATVADVQARMLRQLSTEEQALCQTLIGDAGIKIDDYNADASVDKKQIVTCQMVIRVLGDGSSIMPLGASQYSQSALGYTESFTMASGGSVGELYISKSEKKLLGVGDALGTYSPVQELVRGEL